MQTQYVFNIERALELGILSVLVPPGDAGDGGSGNDGPVDALYEKLLSLLPRSEAVGQRDVLRFIQEQPGATVPAMAEHFSVTTSVIVGIINGGLQRNIKKAGFAAIKPILDIVKEAGQWCYFPGEVLTRQPPVPK